MKSNRLTEQLHNCSNMYKTVHLPVNSAKVNNCKVSHLNSSLELRTRSQTNLERLLNLSIILLFVNSVLCTTVKQPCGISMLHPSYPEHDSNPERREEEIGCTLDSSAKQ
jgi:hypothetical protein